jgi:hypothetical protein
MADKTVRLPTVGLPWTEAELDVIDDGSSVQVNVGRPWNDDELQVIEQEVTQTKLRAVVALGTLFSGLIVLLGVYAVTVGDGRLIDKIFTLASTIVLAVLAWAVGPRLLRMIGSLRFDESDFDGKKT